jgi:hypothetical protein
MHYFSDVEYRKIRQQAIQMLVTGYLPTTRIRTLLDHYTVIVSDESDPEAMPLADIVR